MVNHFTETFDKLDALLLSDKNTYDTLVFFTSMFQ